jgi:hypothetical protein
MFVSRDYNDIRAYPHLSAHFIVYSNIMIPQRNSVQSKQLIVGKEYNFMFAFFSRSRASVLKHFGITGHELYYLMFADYYCEENLFFTSPAIIKYCMFSERSIYPMTRSLVERGFICEYLPAKLNNCSIAYSINVSKRKRRKTGRLYVVTPKGKQVMTYLMRCYNDIHKEIAKNGK